MRPFFAAIAIVAAALGGSADARAETLSATERAKLVRHETVRRDHTMERGDQRYVGGLTYTVIDATPSEVAALLDDAEVLQRVLPRTKQARFVGTASGGDRLLELTQGNAVMEASYTIRVRKEASEVRFWLDPSLPHGIDDAWGFFRWQPVAGAGGETHVLLTYGILVDVGAGILRELFEEKIRTTILTVPQRLRRHVAERAIAAH